MQKALAFEILFPLIIVILWLYLTITKKISPAMSKLWVIAFFLGLTWEMTFRFMGDKWMQIKNPEIKKLPKAVYAISHALQDSLLFMIGIFLAWLLLGKNNNIFCDYKLNVLLIFIIWGFFQEFMIELAYNGKVWEYTPNKFNPTVWSRNGVQYTLVPYLVWIIAPIIFWIITVNIMKSSKNC
jgi:hypothetical protein